MDKKLERSNADKVLRRFAKKIVTYGFVRTKPSFFVREAGLVLEFIHIHKYTFGPYFRMHICFRVLNESNENANLAGPDERVLNDKIKFVYDIDEESVEHCSQVMSDFVVDYVEPWFENWKDRTLLLEKNSPLYDRQKIALRAALQGKSNPENEVISKSSLKFRN